VTSRHLVQAVRAVAPSVGTARRDSSCPQMRDRERAHRGQAYTAAGRVHSSTLHTSSLLRCEASGQRRDSRYCRGVDTNRVLLGRAHGAHHHQHSSKDHHHHHHQSHSSRHAEKRTMYNAFAPPVASNPPCLMSTMSERPLVVENGRAMGYLGAQHTIERST
jgi:hypothetical protein